MIDQEQQQRTRGGRRAGSGRKARNTAQLTLRLSPELIRSLHEVAGVLGLSISELVEKKLKASLKRRK